MATSSVGHASDHPDYFVDFFGGAIPKGADGMGMGYGDQWRMLDRNNDLRNNPNLKKYISGKSTSEIVLAASDPNCPPGLEAAFEDEMANRKYHKNADQDAWVNDETGGVIAIPGRGYANGGNGTSGSGAGGTGYGTTGSGGRVAYDSTGSGGGAGYGTTGGGTAYDTTGSGGGGGGTNPQYDFDPDALAAQTSATNDEIFAMVYQIFGISPGASAPTTQSHSRSKTGNPSLFENDV